MGIIYQTRGLLLTSGVVCLLSLLVSNCRQTVAADVRVPPRRPDAALRPIAGETPPPIRVLVKEGFSTISIKGSDVAPEISIKAKGRMLELKANGRSRTGSGFKIRAARFQFLRYEGIPYRGTIEAFVNPLGQPVLVNEVSLEDYLRGVVPNEIGPKAMVPLEAFKAQAIAARTFTLSNRGRYARLGFDVYSDQRSQVYGGVRNEHELSDRAIRETRGRIASFRDRPILALYSSTCGGVTANYGRIFLATPIEYLDGGVRCRDNSSPYHEWQEEIRIADVRDSLDLYAQVGSLEDVTAGRRDVTGRVVEMTFQGSQGRRTLHGINLRRALGIRSNWITSMKPVRDSIGALRSLRLSGRGWGHGVGLCQFGAIDMARRGSDCRQILEHYYPGAKVTRIY